MSQILLGAGPALPNPRVLVRPSSGSNGVVAPMRVGALQAANRVLMARALEEMRADDDGGGGTA